MEGDNIHLHWMGSVNILEFKPDQGDTERKDAGSDEASGWKNPDRDMRFFKPLLDKEHW